MVLAHMITRATRWRRGMLLASLAASLLGLETAATAEAHEPLEVFRDCADCPEMVVVPAGSFMMGSPADEAGRIAHEGPLHAVDVAAFAVGRFEVTWAEWDACARDSGCGAVGDLSGAGDDRPMLDVSWSEAQAYARWLSRRTGEEYRLLTEAEWEYAARAGTASPYSWGTEEPVCAPDTANGAAFTQCPDNRTHAAGSYAPNPFGLYDMHGNVWEWVEDCYRDSYEGAPADGSAARAPNCEVRVLRGGSWISAPENLRSAYRYKHLPADTYLKPGFRIARTMTTATR